MFGKKDAARQGQTTLDEIISRLTLLRADVTRLETEWSDAKDQIRRSYQRLEKAAQRAEEASSTLTLPEPTNGPQNGRESLDDKILRLKRRSNALLR